MDKKQNLQFHNIPPLFSSQSKTLILGSFPSVKSRENCFFYAHPQNRFWKVLSIIYGSELPQTIEQKKRLILDNNLALFDVIKQCEIIGSSDLSVKNVIPNELLPILEQSQIDKIFVNGKTAQRFYKKYTLPTIGIDCIYLPSTSPANAAFSLEKLVSCWSVIKE